MQQNTTIDNNTFMYVLLGALLFISAITYNIAFHSNIVMLQLSYTFVSLMLDAGAVYLLYKAVRHDRRSLNQV